MNKAPMWRSWERGLPPHGRPPPGPKAHDSSITTEDPDTMRGTDMTTTVEGTVRP
jgi:hypothetical protein